MGRDGATKETKGLRGPAPKANQIRERTSHIKKWKVGVRVPHNRNQGANIHG